MTSTASIVILALPLGGVCDKTHLHHPISFQPLVKARSMGTLVNNDTTSNDTISYFSGMVIDFEKETNSELLETNELELPTSGDSFYSVILHYTDEGYCKVAKMSI